jgi:hypothetical protein
MKKFTVIFLAVFAAFVVLNIALDIARCDGLDGSGVMRYGFPFLYQVDGDYSDRFFSLAALLTDIGIAVVGSALVARFFSSHRHVI